LIEQSRSIPPVELEDHLQSIARHLSKLPDAFSTQIEKKLSLSRLSIKQLMKHHEDAGEMMYSEIRERRLHLMGDPLGNFWACISHELMVNDGLNPPTVWYSIEGGLATGQPLQSVQVDTRLFGKLDWVPDSWGMRPACYSQKLQCDCPARVKGVRGESLN
jgi:hypothetical protein